MSGNDQDIILLYRQAVDKIHVSKEQKEKVRIAMKSVSEERRPEETQENIISLPSRGKKRIGTFCALAAAFAVLLLGGTVIKEQRLWFFGAKSQTSQATDMASSEAVLQEDYGKTDQALPENEGAMKSETQATGAAENLFDSLSCTGVIHSLEEGKILLDVEEPFWERLGEQCEVDCSSLNLEEENLEVGDRIQVTYQGLPLEEEESKNPLSLQAIEVSKLE